MEFKTAGLSRWVPDPKWHKSKKIVHAFADSIIHEAIARQNSTFIPNLKWRAKMEKNAMYS